MRHILINYAFLLLWSIFGKIHSELLFLDIKVTMSQMSTEILRNVFSYHILKVANPEENLDLFKQLFWIKPVKGDKYLKKCFSPQCVPQTVKLCLSVVLKNFWENSHRTSLFSQKSDYLRNEHWNTQKVCFSYHVWIRQILIKNWIYLNNFFLSNQ